MKKLLILSFLFLSVSAHSQWNEQYSGTYQYYNPIFFTDSLNGWIGGYVYDGIKFILKTTDGGGSWDLKTVGNIPASIYFINGLTGYCASYDGIYKSTDGGDSWVLNHADSINYTSIKFVDENNGWAVGEKKFINGSLLPIYLLKTTNGGVSWSKLFLTDGYKPKIEMIDSVTGFIISNSNSSSKIWKTLDGGISWSVVYEDTAYRYLWDISFVDELIGYAGGSKFLFSTTDGGNTWSKQFIPILFIDDIFSQENYCWVSGFGIGYSGIIFSDDFGKTWTPIYVNDSTQINDIFFNDLNNGWFSALKGFSSSPFYNGTINKIKNDWLSDITFPSTPQQIYPANGLMLPQQFNFKFEKLDYTFNRLQLSYDSLFTNLFVITHYQTGDTVYIGDLLLIENSTRIILPPNKKFYWRIRGENKMGVSEWSDTWSFTTTPLTEIKDENIVTDFKLYQNYPNPFNPVTKIRFSIPNVISSETGNLTILKIYDVLGNEVEILVNEEKSPGEYEVEFNAANLSSGIYFYRIKSGGFSQTQKMILMK